MSTVTAIVSPPSPEPVTLRVSASAVSPADGSDFELGANRELTIAANQTGSTGSVTVTAVDDDVDGPEQADNDHRDGHGPDGIGRPGGADADHHRRRRGRGGAESAAPAVTLVLAPEQGRRERGREPRVRAVERSLRPGRDRQRLGRRGGAGRLERLALGANRNLTIAAGETESTGGGDGDGSRRRRGRPEQADNGHRDGGGSPGVGGAGAADADHHRRRRGGRRRRRDQHIARVFPKELRVPVAGRTRWARGRGSSRHRGGDGPGARGADLRVGERRGQPVRSRGRRAGTSPMSVRGRTPSRAPTGTR